MKRQKTLLAIVLAGMASAASAQQPSQPQEGIVRANSKPAVPGSPNFFVGKAEVRPVISPEAPGRTSIGSVVFQPGARSNWHTHPAGQALYITEGCGWTQREGGPVVRICAGDAAYVPAGVRHWHGATDSTGMTQLAITETVDGRNVDWMEPVTDAQYAAGASAGK